MRNYGYFDSAEGDEKKLKEMCFDLLENHYCRLNTSRKEDVFHQAFSDKKMTRSSNIQKKMFNLLLSLLMEKRRASSGIKTSILHGEIPTVLEKQLLLLSKKESMNWTTERSRHQVKEERLQL